MPIGRLYFLDFGFWMADPVFGSFLGAEDPNRWVDGFALADAAVLGLGW